MARTASPPSGANGTPTIPSLPIVLISTMAPSSNGVTSEMTPSIGKYRASIGAPGSNRIVLTGRVTFLTRPNNCSRSEEGRAVRIRFSPAETTFPATLRFMPPLVLTSTYVRCGTDLLLRVPQIMPHRKVRQRARNWCDQRRGWRVAAERTFPEPGVLDPGDQFWLEAMADAVLILSPMYGARRQVTDFRVEYANGAGDELAGDPTTRPLRRGSLIGAGFLTLDQEAANAVCTALRDVLATDVPCAIDGLRYRVLRAGISTEQERYLR